jgi:hypothetical protein
MEQMTLYLVMGGLLILTLALASIAQRYNAYVEERRRKVERILRRVEELDELAGQLRGLPLPPGLMALLRRDALARLEVVRQIHPRHPGLSGLIEQAKASLAETQIVHSAPQTLDEGMLNRLMKGLGRVSWMLQEQRFMTPLQEAEGAQLGRAIAMQQAEQLYRFHMRQVEKRSTAGELYQALWHCNQVRQFLRDKAPDDEQTEVWYQAVDERYRSLTAQLKGQSSEAPPESPS